MARKSYGNTIKYEKRTGYVQGNTVRKLQVAEPYSNDPTSIEQLEEGWETFLRRIPWIEQFLS